MSNKQLLNKCVYTFRGKEYRINPNLVRKSGVTDEGIENIISLHKARLEFCADLEKAGVPEAAEERARCVSVIRDIEFALQKEWGFGQDEDFHVYWNSLPGCKCPVMDNLDARGTKYRHINKNCPYHGS